MTSNLILFLYLGIASILSLSEGNAQLHPNIAANWGSEEDETSVASQTVQILALYDFETGMIYYKDESYQSCFSEEVHESELSRDEILLIPEDLRKFKEYNSSSIFAQEFCQGYPIYSLAQFRYRSRNVRVRGKRSVQNGYYNNYVQGGSSQSQIQGQVYGQGYFSSQAQSQVRGSSQSQVQLSGTGITGNVASSAGNTQTQISLNENSGSGQAGSQGTGRSNSQVQVNLDKSGRGSMASASVLDEGGETHGGFRTQAQPNWTSGGSGHGQRGTSGFNRRSVPRQQYSDYDEMSDSHQSSGATSHYDSQEYDDRNLDLGRSRSSGSGSDRRTASGFTQQRASLTSNNAGGGAQAGAGGGSQGSLAPCEPHTQKSQSQSQSASGQGQGSFINCLMSAAVGPGRTGSARHFALNMGGSHQQLSSGSSSSSGINSASDTHTQTRTQQATGTGSTGSFRTSGQQHSPPVHSSSVRGFSSERHSSSSNGGVGVVRNDRVGSVYAPEVTATSSTYDHDDDDGRIVSSETQRSGHRYFQRPFSPTATSVTSQSQPRQSHTQYSSYDRGGSSASSGNLPHAYASSHGGGQAQAQTVYLGSGTSEFYDSNQSRRVSYGSSSYPGSVSGHGYGHGYGQIGGGGGRGQTQYASYDTTLQNQREYATGARETNTNTGQGQYAASENEQRRNAYGSTYSSNTNTERQNGNGVPNQPRATTTDGYVPTDRGHVRLYQQSGTRTQTGDYSTESPSPTAYTFPPIRIAIPTTYEPPTYSPVTLAPVTFRSSNLDIGAGSGSGSGNGYNYNYNSYPGPPETPSHGRSSVSHTQQQSSGGYSNTNTYIPTGQGQVSSTNYDLTYPSSSSSGNINSNGYGIGVTYHRQPQQPYEQSQSGYAPAYGVGVANGDSSGRRTCQIITFTCTYIIESNGRAKICRPKVAQSNGNGNVAHQQGAHDSSGRARQICCC